MDSRPWEFWIDVGGTFTDCFARRPDGALVRHKLLSSGVTKGAAATGSTSLAIVDPARLEPWDFWRGYGLRLMDGAGQPVGERRVIASDPDTGTLQLESPLPHGVSAGQVYELLSGEEAPVLAIRRLLGLGLADAIPPVVVRLGTTRGTNALITRRGARTAFVTTRGFGDVLSIGYQNRPKLFELAIHKPSAAVCGGAGDRRADRRRRAGAAGARRGRCSRRNCASCARQGSSRWRFACCTRIANAEHEDLVGQIAREVGFEEISLSQPRGAAGQDRGPRRHHRGRCLSESGAARVRRAARAGAARRPTCGS